MQTNIPSGGRLVSERRNPDGVVILENQGNTNARKVAVTETEFDALHLYCQGIGTAPESSFELELVHGGELSMDRQGDHFLLVVTDANGDSTEDYLDPAAVQWWATAANTPEP